ncbi:MAG: cyclophilin-like fold protein [Proteobacteria bacterium]|nr:cyclophilin-like fold protein [Pseudomonadota bacterium]
MSKIRIIIKDKIINAELFDTDCAKKIFEALPIESSINEWGEEFYFTIPVSYGNDNTSTRKVKVGDIGYWPPGNALCIFFGPTPMSTSNDPVPASEVNIVGRITDDPEVFKGLRGIKKILIEKL